MFQVYGIRHHGPGSARNILEALDEQAPDLILVEGPSDSGMPLEFIGTDALTPPVALLVYDPRDYKQATFYPFATFSPEWQAIEFAHKKNIPVAFIDLPLSIIKEWGKQAALRLSLAPEEKTAEYSGDPLGEIARLAGYSDSEAWWDLMFERKPGKAVFEHIGRLMEALRDDLPGSPMALNTAREAWMREAIRKHLKKFQNIAVICGAFHAPALQATSRIPSATDKKILKGLKAKKMASTWVPWSYDRLAYQSGYKAGVLSPAWYELLFASPEDAPARWMVRAARLLREQDFDASSAQVIDAIRLTKTLATLRNQEVPGIAELLESAISVLGSGATEKLEWLHRQIVIGEKMGSVSPKVPRIPLQEDIEKTLRKTRLNKDWNTAGTIEKKLDLRKENQQEASIFLYRLQLIDIFWGKRIDNSPYNTGSFSEAWVLERQPAFDLAIIEAGVWGNTLPEACLAKVKHGIRNQKKLEKLSALLYHSLIADLPLLVAELIVAIREVAAHSRDVRDMMKSVPELATILRYGHTRKTETGAVAAILDSIFPRFCIGLPSLVQQIDPEQAEIIRRYMLRIQRNLHILPDPNFAGYWLEALDRIAGLPAAHPKIKGISTRLRFERRHINATQMEEELYLALSRGQSPEDTAFWLEGFLTGNRLQILYQPALWEKLNQWIADISEEAFLIILPVLRRTFDNNSVAERKKILDAAKFGLPHYLLDSEEENLDPKRKVLITNTLQQLLGWNLG